MSFYTKEEEQQRKDYVPVLRERILKRLEDLKKKIETNEPCPEQEQGIDLLSQIDDELDSILNAWYY